MATKKTTPARAETAPVRSPFWRTAGQPILVLNLSAFEARVGEVLPHGLRIVREGHLGLLDLGVPALLPLEAVVAFIPVLHEHGDRLLDRNLAGPRQDVAAVVLGLPGDGQGVLEVRVARVF